MTEVDYFKIGAKIRYYRRLKNVSQTIFAGDVGLSPQYLSKIECGKRIPSLPVLIRIAEHLDVDLGELIKSDNL